MSEVRLTLPIPPSANNLFANARRKKKGTKKGGGRYITKAYKAWRIEAGWTLMQQRPGMIVGPYELHIVLPKMRANADIDNKVKPLSDLLVTHGVTDDDKHCRLITVGRDDTASAVVVTVREAA